MAETLDIKLRELSADDRLDIYSPAAIILCPTCEVLLGTGFPLWGLHLFAALALHAAHRAVDELRDVPALTDDDRVLGLRLEKVRGG